MNFSPIQINTLQTEVDYIPILQGKQLSPSPRAGIEKLETKDLSENTPDTLSNKAHHKQRAIGQEDDKPKKVTYEEHWSNKTAPKGGSRASFSEHPTNDAKGERCKIIFFPSRPCTYITIP